MAENKNTNSYEKEEIEAEERFEQILRTIPKYGKNDTTLSRYLNYHKEIQGLLQH